MYNQLKEEWVEDAFMIASKVLGNNKHEQILYQQIAESVFENMITECGENPDEWEGPKEAMYEEFSYWDD